MNSLQSQDKDNQEKDLKSQKPHEQAPFLTVLDSKRVTNFLTGMEEHIRYVTVHNEKNPDKKKAEVTLLGQISPALKEQILDDTLPSGFACLQDFYPATRQFFSNSIPLDELAQQVRSRAIVIVKGLVGDLVDFLKLELQSLIVSREHSESEDQSMSSEEPATSALANEPSSDHDSTNFLPPSTDIGTLELTDVLL